MTASPPTAGLYFYILQPPPYDLAVVDSAGTIAAGTRSYALVSVYDTVDTDSDAFGLAFGTFAYPSASVVQNHTNAANKTLTFSWTAPRAGLRPPDHYLLAYQSGATWDPNATGVIIETISGSATSVVITDIASEGTFPAFHVGSGQSVLTAKLSSIVERPMSARGFNGVVAPLSFAFTPTYMPGGVLTEVSPFESLSWTFPRAGLASAHQSTLAKLRKWADRGWPVLVYDFNASSILEYDFYHGTIKLNSLADIMHEDNQLVTLTMMVEGVHRL